ncbi:MAG: DUF4034 domain-containing protein [Candidatus Melainabacteria bacterium]|nr:DUF4034 domain-containing protein [Candidatus Melainabacteria bacterium]
MQSNSNRESKKKIALTLGLTFLAGASCLAVAVIAAPKTSAQLQSMVDLLSGGPSWKREFDAALKAKRSGINGQDAIIQKCLETAKSQITNPADMLTLYRDYAYLLYDANEWQKAEIQMQKAIDCAPPHLEKGEYMALLVLNIYYDRGYEKYKRYESTRKGDPGIDDLKKSIALSDEHFGTDEPDRFYKTGVLAVMLQQTGKMAEGDELMAQSMAAIPKYAKLTQQPATLYKDKACSEINHKQPLEGLKWLLKARKTSTTERNPYGHMRDFLRTFRYNYQEPKTQASVAGDLLASKDYTKLDALGETCLKQWHSYPDGDDDINRFYKSLLGQTTREGQESDAGYKAKIEALQQWLKANPKSLHAKVALASLYKQYAWFGRGSGFADTVTSDGFDAFDERLAKAASLLDSVPNIIDKNPQAATIYSAVYLNHWPGQQEYYNFLDRVHKHWPEYKQIDSAAEIALLQRWHGDEGEVEKFVEERSNQIAKDKGAIAGDEMYAYLTYHHNFEENKFTPGKAIYDWQRAKRGWESLISSNPQFFEDRFCFYWMALSAEESDEEIIRVFGDTSKLLQHS